jgi:YesN/AraC family two-component response regulator
METIVDLETIPGNILIVDDEPHIVRGIMTYIEVITAGMNHFSIKENIETASNG